MLKSVEEDLKDQYLTPHRNGAYWLPEQRLGQRLIRRFHSAVRDFD
jgi:hypothetical protein